MLTGNNHHLLILTKAPSIRSRFFVRTGLFFLILLMGWASPLWAKEDLAKALFDTGQKLDGMVNELTEKAEKKCYWNKGGEKSHACMKNFVDDYNRQYGAGSFTFDAQMNVFHYTGVHYEKVLQQHPTSDYAPAAEFELLKRNLIGVPDEVLPRVEQFLEKHRGGEWYRKGALLLARLNQDLWYIHKYRSWVLYNWKISDEELIIKAETYRAAALKHFEALFKKEGRTAEGKAAKKEQSLLKEHKDDGKLYGIVGEAG